MPKLMCVAWYSLDVLFTSSTIIHLCMISIDRYMSLKYPLKYGHAKKTKHTIFKIVLVWIISFCIAGPLFLFSMFDTQKNVYYKGCGPETTTFVLSATITSFYLPLLIMTIMYILTVRALHEQRKAQRKLAVTNSASSTLSLREESAYNFKRLSKSTQGSFGNGEVGRGSERESLHHSSGLGGRSPLLPHKEYGNNGGGGGGGGGGLGVGGVGSGGGGVVTSNSRKELAPLGYERSDMYLCVESTYERGLTPSSTCTDIHLQELDSNGENHHLRDGSRKTKVRTFKFRRGDNSNSSSKRQNLDKGRRAVQVLGIMFAMFVVFYLPFFATYVVNATCMVCRPYISPHVMVAFEWLAYSGSMVNPIIYHVFNPDFQRSFQKLLRCRCRPAATTT